MKVVIHKEGVFYTSVFHQFSGKFGPTAIAVDPEGMIYVARFDFHGVSEDGLISVLNPQTGEITETLKIGEPVYIEPIIANGRVYVLTDGGKLVAVR